MHNRSLSFDNWLSLHKAYRDSHRHRLRSPSLSLFQESNQSEMAVYSPRSNSPNISLVALKLLLSP
jgi:hypothetical protein